MSPRSSIPIRPDIHARFTALVARADAKLSGREYLSSARSARAMARREAPIADERDDDQATS
jgi:hypothetical protein